MFQHAVDEQDGTTGREGTSRFPRTHPSNKPKVVFRSNVKRWAINLFLGFHLLGITCWCLPIDTPVLALSRKFVRPYFLWVGLFQSWDMFAPVPKGANTYIEATLIYSDRSRATWTYPRMDQLSLTQKLFKERYRKFADYLQTDDFDDLLPDAARYIARLNSRPQHPVKTIILVEKFSLIVPHPDGSNAPAPWDAHVLLGYGVRPEDLR